MLALTEWLLKGPEPKPCPRSRRTTMIWIQRRYCPPPPRPPPPLPPPPHSPSLYHHHHLPSTITSPSSTSSSSFHLPSSTSSSSYSSLSSSASSSSFYTSTQVGLGHLVLGRRKHPEEKNKDVILFGTLLSATAWARSAKLIHSLFPTKLNHKNTKNTSYLKYMNT